MRKIVFFFTVAFLGLLGIFVYQYSTRQNGLLRVIFCDVGQGDAIYIRTPLGSDVLIDGGPDDTVLSCLSDHMPMWDRTIELVILSHPHADHFIGFLSVLERYEVASFAMEELDNDTPGYGSLELLLSRKRIPVRKIYERDVFEFGKGVGLRVLGPSRQFLKTKSPDGMIGDSGEFASLILQLTYGSFDLLLTGDSQLEGLYFSQAKGFDVLQVPHHGSKSGLDARIVSLVDPKLAVVSVGKNRYGHPSRDILEILQDAGIRVSRTDQVGDVRIYADGKNWWVK